MKINIPGSGRKTRDGSAVIVVLAFLTIMMLLIAANTKTINWVRAEVRLTNQREIARLNASVTHHSTGPATPLTPATTP